MAELLKGKRVAILATHGFEESELEEPTKALPQAGATAEVESPTSGQIRGWNHTGWGGSVLVDVERHRADPSRYDALVLPGGVMASDARRTSRHAVKLVRAFVCAEKPIAAICHGPWILIDAAGVRGRPMTFWPSLQLDLENAGAKRARKMIEEISEGHERRA